VGGVAFGYDRAAKANVEWKRLLKGRTFHMTDLNARKGDFKDINDGEVLEIMKGIVRIIRTYASNIAVVSFDERLISEAFPTNSNADRDSEELRNAFRTPYGMLGHLCMSRLGVFSEESGRRDGRDISYILERGDGGQKGLIRFIEYIQKHPFSDDLLKLYSMSRATVASKNEMDDIFHATDFVAWEWLKHVSRQRVGAPMRKSLSELTGRILAESDYFGLTLGQSGDNYMFRHYDARHVDRFVRFVRNTIEAATGQEVAAAIQSWEDTRVTK
jgi:hypothetical protein